MTRFDQLTIVTSSCGYGKYLQAWSNSIAAQTVKPGAAVVFTHGSAADSAAGIAAVQRLSRQGVEAYHVHHVSQLDFGVARNSAVELAKTEWVMHLDADDTLLPHAVEEYLSLEAGADVLSSGYYRTGQMANSMSKRARLYESADGERALLLSSICSGVSPFRKSLWEKSPYRTDMVGAWDTALWIGLARLGARFRATKRPVFNYNQHSDSIFNKRRKLNNWTRVRTTAHLKSCAEMTVA